jgi:hypothetical protein
VTKRALAFFVGLAVRARTEPSAAIRGGAFDSCRDAGSQIFDGAGHRRDDRRVAGALHRHGQGSTLRRQHRAGGAVPDGLTRPRSPAFNTTFATRAPSCWFGRRNLRHQ